MSVNHSDPRQGHEKCFKKFQKCENEYKKQIAILQQKIQFLKQDLKQYEQRDQDNKKINESIMLTYQQTESMREQYTAKTIKQLTHKYQTEMKRVKEQNNLQNKKLQEQLYCLRDKYDQALIQLQKQKLQHERAIIQMKKRQEQTLYEVIKEKEEQCSRKLETAEEKVKQAEAMSDVYKQFVKKRRELIENEDECYVRGREGSIRGSSAKKYTRNKENLYTEGERRSLIQNIEQSNVNGQRMLSASKESMKIINTKINRAITQLKAPSTYHEKLNQRLNRKN